MLSEVKKKAIAHLQRIFEKKSNEFEKSQFVTLK